ncbi:MAG: TerD family protein [Planctomycetaceae bacterium]|jgi:tellurium resistance protein TerD|nr:TerD family protein [Planctomycetaceae bacterium]
MNNSLETTKIKIVLSRTTDEFDLDLSAFLLGNNGKVRNNTDFVFYENTSSSCGGVKHRQMDQGESLLVESDKLSDDIRKIVFTVSIRESAKQNWKFEQSKNACIVLYDGNNMKSLYYLREDSPDSTAFSFIEIYRNQHGWCFRNLCEGSREELPKVAERYGVKPLSVQQICRALDELMILLAESGNYHSAKTEVRDKLESMIREINRIREIAATGETIGTVNSVYGLIEDLCLWRENYRNTKNVKNIPLWRSDSWSRWQQAEQENEFKKRIMERLPKPQ